MSSPAKNASADVLDDPYSLDERNIKQPPEGWRQSLRYFGPGLIMSASIVGSGELIATTTAGAKVGFALLWLVIVSTFVKVGLQIELAKWSISTGRSGMTGFNQVPPKIGNTGWISWVWLLMALAKILQQGGIVGGAAVTLSMLFPFGGDPLNVPTLMVWTIALVALSIAMLITNKYGVIEGISTVFVATLTLITVVMACGLTFTPFAYGWHEIALGLSFTLPSVGVAVAMFGITGVGADEIAFYTYWVVEKGYAAYTGPNDGSEAWKKRANGWITVMKRDSWISWGVYTLATLAFYTIGAAVLHPQGLVPQGNGVIITLSRMYTDALGQWAMYGFLIAAFAALASTMWAAIPSHSRLWANFLANVGVFDWQKSPKKRMAWIRLFMIVLPIVWALAFFLMQEPVIMVQIGGIATSLFLLAVLVGTWYLRRTETDESLLGSKSWTVMLAISSLTIVMLSIYTALDVFDLVPS